MSLYNMINEMNGDLAIMSTPFLPMPPEQFPRFRDIFLSDEECPLDGYDILVYTRMGGGNLDCWEGTYDESCDCYGCSADKIEEDPSCLGSYDDADDCTYRTFAFKVNENREWFDAIREKEFNSLPPEYFNKLRSFYTGREEVLEWINKFERACKL